MRARYFDFVLLAALATMFLLVPVTEGPLRSSALAAGKCGGVNQQACKVWQRPGRPCDAGLVEVTSNAIDPNAGRCVRKSSARRGCGKEGQRACTVFERPGRPCDGRLVERTRNYLDPTAGRCEKFDPNNPGTIIDNVRDLGNVIVATSTDTVTQVPAIIGLASRDAGRLAPLSFELGGMWVRCAAGFNGMRQGSGQRFYDAIVDSPCFLDTLEIARRHGYRTVTIGLAGGVAGGVGVELETGLAFDVEGMRNATAYDSQSLKINSYGAGGALTIGLWRPANDAIAGDGQGVAGGIEAFGGSGGGIWYDYDRNFTGFSVSMTAGAGGEAAYVRNTVQVQGTNIRPVRPDARAPAYGSGETNMLPGNGDRIAAGPYGRAPDPTLLKVCNDSGERFMYAALAYYDVGSRRGSNSWTSKGWLEIADGECRNFVLPQDETGGPYGGEVYMMGTAERTDWNLPDAAFCVGQTDEFEIVDADSTDCDGKDYVLTSKRFEVSRGRENVFTFAPGTRVAEETILKVCNRTSRPTIDFAIASDRGPAHGGIVSRGWWSLERGECYDMNLVDAASGNAKTGHIYLTARSDVATYGYGGGRLCFNPATGTRIDHADTAECARDLRDTARIEVSPGRTSRFDFHD
jgi:uncharacterized membrane protein